jgi:hypothetical protein
VKFFKRCLRELVVRINANLWEVRMKCNEDNDEIKETKNGPKFVMVHHMMIIVDIAEKRLTPNALVVWIVLDFHAQDSGICWVAWDTLRAETGLGEEAVGTALRLLEELGYIRRFRRHNRCNIFAVRNPARNGLHAEKFVAALACSGLSEHRKTQLRAFFDSDREMESRHSGEPGSRITGETGTPGGRGSEEEALEEELREEMPHRTSADAFASASSGDSPLPRASAEETRTREFRGDADREEDEVASSHAAFAIAVEEVAAIANALYDALALDENKVIYQLIEYEAERIARQGGLARDVYALCGIAFEWWFDDRERRVDLPAKFVADQWTALHREWERRRAARLNDETDLDGDTDFDDEFVFDEETTS